MLEGGERLQVLKYWRSVLRHEAATEAGFTEHPDASDDGPFEPSLPWPQSDWAYFERPLADDTRGLAEFLLCQRRSLDIDPLSSAHGGFFERWLARHVRRARLRERGVPWLEMEPTVYVGFPVIRRSERREKRLVPVIELAVRPVWLDADGLPWNPADFRHLSVGEAPPTSLSLELIDDRDGGLPYVLNRAALERGCGLEPHVLTALGAWLAEREDLSPEAMITAVLHLLRTGDPERLDDPHDPDLGPEALLDALAAEVLRAARPRGGQPLRSVVVFESDAGVPTARLQEELNRVIASAEEEPLPPSLDLWLGGEVAIAKAVPRRALRWARPLTTGQAEAIELSRGSRLVAVEGPPGTGKTALIVNLAAEVLVDHVARGVYDRRRADPDCMVIASTNNQAVDHALAALEGPGGIPVAIRLGNRRVQATRTSTVLARVEGLLAAADQQLGRVELDAAHARFDLASQRVERAEADAPDGPRLAQELFRAAVAVRDAWARSEREALLTLLRLERRRGEAPHWQSWWLEEPEWRALIGALFPIAGTTLLSLGHGWPLEQDLIGQLVIDEAGQCHAPYIATALYRSRRALVIGDVHQLQPIVALNPAEDVRLMEEAGLSAEDPRLSPFRMAPPDTASAQTISERGAARTIALRDHFRCQPEIIAISSHLCGYELEVRTPRESLVLQSPLLVAPVILVPSRGPQRAWGKSQQNPDEAECIARITRRLIDDGLPAAEIGIVTPYQAQYHLLRRLLQREGIVAGGWPAGSSGDGRADEAVLLGTIHRLQGGERDVVLLSMVARNPGSLRWIDERPNLLNVAVSRARLHLLIVGDPDTLSAGVHTRALVDAVPPEAWLEELPPR